MQFPRLRVLALSGNNLQALGPLQLGGLTNLKSLNASHNDLTMVEGLEGLTGLTELVLEKNRIRRVAGFWVVYCTRLACLVR